MKKILIVLLCAASYGVASAQQLPLFSQYYFNSFIYNPAHTGQEAGTTLGLVGRKQFTGLSNSIGTYATTLQSRNGESRSGFGLYAYNDQVNLFRTNSISGSYAYHIPLSRERTLSFGLALTALDHKYNASNFYLVNPEDPVVALLGEEGGFTVDANAGVNMDFGKFSMGLANLQMLQNQEAFKNNANSKTLYTLANHWIFNAGYKAVINENLELNPFLLYRKTQAAPGQVDLNLFLNWIDKGYAGIAYRDGMSFSAMLGVTVNKATTLGYSYDITTNKLRTALGNTHEVALRFNLGRKISGAQGEDILSSTLETDYETRIAELEQKVATLKTVEPSRIDTVVIEKVIVKEVPIIKEVPASKLKDVVVTLSKPKDVVIEPAKPTAKLPVASISTQFYVIAGSFANSSAASSYISTLAIKGHKAYQKFDATNGRHYVHIGKFSVKPEAVNLIQGKKGSGLPLWIKTM
jgi:type IX secretion system PorP/SprF family membrane protein